MRTDPQGSHDGELSLNALDGLILNQRYQLKQFLRRAPETATLLAVDNRDESDVIVQVVAQSRVPVGAQMRIEHETRRLAFVKSSWLQSPQDFGQEGPWLYLVTPFLAGETLSDRNRRGPRPLNEALSIAAALFSALIDVHRAGALHRAVNPGHVVFGNSGSSRVKLTGFGLSAAVLASTSSQEMSDAVRYFPPEQAGLLDRDLGPPTDLYSAGVVLFECLAGHPPFVGEAVSQLLMKQMTVPVPRLRRLGLDVPRALDEVLQRLLRKDPRDRYQSAEAVLADIRSLRQAVRQGMRDPRIVVGGRDRRTTLTDAVFIGRDREQKLLDRQVVRTRQGQGGLVLLESESGGGKTRLLLELAERAAADGCLVFRGHASSDGTPHPVEAFKGVIDGCVKLFADDPELAAEVARKLSADRKVLAQAFPALKDAVPWPETAAEEPELEAGERRKYPEGRIVVAISRLLDSLGTAQRPTIILLDDGQWMDELTVKTLIQWFSRPQQSGSDHRYVGVIVAFRTEEVVRDAVLRRIRPSAHIQLTALDDRDVEQLAESMAGPLPSQIKKLVCRLSHGSPFMASAVMHGLVESRMMIREPDGWRIEAVGAGDLQSSAHAAEFLKRRLELLPRHVTQFLTVGAILGKEFNLRIAADLAGIASENAIAALDEARNRHLLWVRPDGSRCVFVHDKIRSALLSELPDDMRQKLHFAAAVHLKKHAPSANFDLAYHFDAAQRSDLAMPFALRAAEEARQCQAYELAEEQYQIAERGLGEASDEVRFTIAEGLGDVMMMRGRYAEAAEFFEKTSCLASDSLRQAASLSKLGELALRQGDAEKAEEALVQSLRLLGVAVPKSGPLILLRILRSLVVRALRRTPRDLVTDCQEMPSDRDRLIGKVIRQLSRVAWCNGPARYMLWTQLAAMNLYERIAVTADTPHVYAEHAMALTAVRRFSTASDFVSRSIEMADHRADNVAYGKAMFARSFLALSQGQFTEAEEDARESVRLNQRAGRVWDVHSSVLLLAEVLYRQGNLKGAAEEACRVHQMASELGDQQAVAASLALWARSTGGGLPPDVVSELHREQCDALGRSQLLLAEGIRLIQLEQLDDAVSVLGRAVAITRGIGVRPTANSSTYPWYLTAIRRHIEKCSTYDPKLRRKLISAAEGVAQQAVRMAKSYVCDRPHVFRELGLLASLQGRPQEARRWIEKSIFIAESQSATYELAKSRSAYGRLGGLFHWDNAARQQEMAEQSLRRMELVYEDQLPLDINSGATLSLADRFENVLETGRRIASALTDENVFLEVHQATLRLLRAECSVILRVDGGEGESRQTLEAVVGDVNLAIDESMVWKAIRSGRAFSFTEESGSRTSSDVFANELSVLCAPIFVRGIPKACLYVTQGQVSGCFGENEERLAGFIRTLAGAALENAHGFKQLQRLNESLEQRVAERTAAAENRARELTASNEQLERTAAELRSAQADLREAKDAAVAASEAKSQFLATVSHEIRTPLNGVIGMSDLALTTKLDSRQRGYLEVVRSSAESLLRLLNDVLDFSKIEAGKLELEQIEFSVAEQVCSSLQVAAGIAAEKKIELLHDLPKGLPDKIVGDPARLQQVLINLVGNAIKFTSEGEIAISVEIADQNDRQLTLQFSVSDTGIGIPPEQRDRIFESFQQADSSTTRRYGGTGLGLSISSQLVQLMDGRIWVESEVGQGSTFLFTAKFEMQQEDVAALPTLMNEPHVLILDENRRRQEIYARWLEQHGAHVEVVANPSDVLPTLLRAETEQRPFQFALLDGPSYDGSGWDLVSAIREIDTLVDCTIGLQIPPVPNDRANECLEFPLVTCLTKPVPLNSLVVACRKETGKRVEAKSTSMSNAARDAQTPLILLAEDGQVNQMVAVGLLEMISCRVDVVDNGRAAVEARQRKDYDLILMDVEMPEMDGIEATEAIRAAEQRLGQTRIPIVAMTAHAITGFQERCQAVGMDRFLPKPVQADELYRTVRELTGHVAESPAAT